MPSPQQYFRVSIFTAGKIRELLRENRQYLNSIRYRMWLADTVNWNDLHILIFYYLGAMVVYLYPKSLRLAT